MNYHNITTDDMKNGQGLRTVLWVAGCGHQCPGCHNPITWDARRGLPFEEETKKELFQKLSPDYIAGLTLSGGDPLYLPNRNDIALLVKQVKETFPHKTIWLYTGFLWEEICALPMIKYIDVVVDGKFIESQKDQKLHWKGSKNQRVIDVPKSLFKNQIILLEE